MKLKRTKIVATIGPATHTEEMIGAIIEAGVDVVRLNFSHGSYEDHSLLIDRVRACAARVAKPVAILQDLQGPKIRLGKLPEAGIEILDNAEIIFDTSLEEYAGAALPVDFAELHLYVKPGERLLINDGRVQTKIMAVDGTKIFAQVLHGGLLSAHKGINVPDSAITVSALSDKDKADAEFGVAHNVDFIALSFVKQAGDIAELRALIPDSIQIIAKMERPEALANQAEIMAAADGIMVARGDLGIEIEPARVPIVQKQLVEAARLANKTVIVATQMLDSMQNSPLPTRAEVSDVANAVIDHTDAVMLSNETATGSFPLETVTMMTEIIVTTEASFFDDNFLPHPEIIYPLARDIVSEHLRLVAEKNSARAIFTISNDGVVARHLSRYRPQVPIISLTNSAVVARQLALVSGIYAVVARPTTADEAIAVATQFAEKLGLINSHEPVLIAFGDSFNYGTRVLKTI